MIGGATECDERGRGSNSNSSLKDARNPAMSAVKPWILRTTVVLCVEAVYRCHFGGRRPRTAYCCIRFGEPPSCLKVLVSVSQRAEQ